MHAAQSKYCVTPTNVALKEIDAGRDRLAIVALPCQVHALRALEDRGHPAMKAVSLVIGLYCGNQLHFGATRSFLKRRGAGDLSEVAEIRYREGRGRDKCGAGSKTGGSRAVPKFHFNHLISFYVVGRCLLCADLAAEGADVSVADAWDAGEAGGGSSLVVSRTARGESAVADLAARGVLKAEEIDLEARPGHARPRDRPEEDRGLAPHRAACEARQAGAAVRSSPAHCRAGPPNGRSPRFRPFPPLRHAPGAMDRGPDSLWPDRPAVHGRADRMEARAGRKWRRRGDTETRRAESGRVGEWERADCSNPRLRLPYARSPLVSPRPRSPVSRL